jgi:hypothetical protein
MQSLLLRTSVSRAQPVLRRASHVVASVQTWNRPTNFASNTTNMKSLFSSDSSHNDFAPKRKFIDDVDEALKIIKVDSICIQIYYNEWTHVFSLLTSPLPFFCLNHNAVTSVSCRK